MPATIFGNSAAALGLYQAFYGKAPGYATFTNNIALAVESGPSALATAVAKNFNSTKPSELAATVLTNVGITNAVLQDALTQYFTAYTAPATRGQVVLNLVTLLSGLEGDAVYGSAASNWNALVARNNLYSSSSTNTADAVINTKVSALTTGLDNLIGSALAETFNANVVQNSLGEQTNQLATGDAINGGGGDDTLVAVVQQASALNGTPVSAIRPITVDVENVKITALTANNNGLFASTEMVNINAAQMNGLDSVHSINSDASLVIQNLNTLTDSGVYAERRNTDAITIRMDHSGNDAVIDKESDLTVLFDNDYLLAGQVNTNKLEIRLANNLPLKNADTPLVGFESVSFSVGGVVVTAVVTPAMEALKGQAAYAALKTAIETEITKLGIKDVTVNLLPQEPTVFSIPLGGNAIGSQAGVFTPIEVVSTGGKLATGTIATVSNIKDYNGVNTESLGAQSTVDNPITSNIELFKVGRGADGGDLVVGGMSTDFANNWRGSDTALEQGVEQFNVKVSGDQTQMSSLASLSSTNNTLQTVNVTWAAGSLADLIIGNKNTVGATTNALKDVRTFTAVNNNTVTDARGKVVTNDVTLNAHVSDESVAKYMDLKDNGVNPSNDNANFVYTTGAGNDTLNLNISKANLAASGTTNREDFTFTINSGAGKDKISTKIGDGTGVAADAWYINSELNDNLAINAGDGDDTVTTSGAGSWNTDLGAGDDTVYTDNSGASKATWVFNTADQAGVVAAARNLNNLVSSANTKYSNLFKATAAVTFKGITSAPIVIGDTNFAATDLQINQAIKKAINDDAVLSKLLVATDGPANTLVVTSLIDGVRVAGDLDVAFTAPTPATITATDAAAYNAAIKPLVPVTAAALQALIAADVVTLNAAADYNANLANTGGVDITGANSIAINANVITPGTGNDVVVLSTSNAVGAFSSETVKYGAAAGSDTIVNFQAGALATGGDVLDFSALGGRGANFAGAAFSATNTSITVQAVVDAGADGVYQAGDTFNTAALKTTFDANAAEDLVASTHVFVTVNASNVGTVYTIADGIAADDSVVTLVGTIDLADTAWGTLVAANFA